MDYPGFARALLDPTLACPVGVRVYDGSDPTTRFAVYRNNVVASLVGALGEGFPVVRELVDEAFFAVMARAFAMHDPPRSPVLADWGDSFADFVERFEPAAGVPYLADVARLERARVLAYHAADAPTIGADALARRFAETATIADARVRLHPSVHVVVSRFAIVSLWAAHHGHGEVARIDPCAREAALVLREGDDASVIRLPHDAAVFVHRLAQGDTLLRAAGEAEAAAASIGEPFDLARNLGVLVDHPVLCAWLEAQEDRK